MGEAQASVLDILKKETKDSEFTLDKHLQKDVVSLLPSYLEKNYKNLYIALEKKDYSQSLKLWSSSFQKTSFAKTSTGKALYAFLMFKNGFQVLGLNHLLNEVEPKKVNPIIYNLWRTNFNSNQDVWNYFIGTWSKDWTDFFNEDIALKVGSKKEFSLVKDRKQIEYFLKLPVHDKNNDYYLEWSLVRHLIKKNDMNSATKILAWLLKQTEDLNHKNTIYLTIARLLNEIGEYESAVYYYNKVKKLSFKWLLAQEEKSWIHYNKGDYAQSFSSVSSFTYPPLQDVLTPSMFLILSLSQLKNCDYPNLNSSLSYFKEHFSKRQSYLKNSLKKNFFEDVKTDLLASYSIDNKLLSFKHLSSLLKSNRSIKNLILLKKFTNNEMSSVEGFKPLEKQYNDFVKNLDKQIDRKISVFFQKEVSQIAETLSQMYFIEMEALYRIHGYHRNRKNLFPTSNWKSVISNLKEGVGYEVTFPFDAREIWGDEIGDYQTSFSKACPKKSYTL